MIAWETISGKAVAEKCFGGVLLLFVCCASSQTMLICCWGGLLDHAAGSMGYFYDQTAASTKPQQLNSNAPSWPGVLLTPARCGWPAGRGGNELKQGWTLALWMRKVPGEMDFFVCCWEQPPPLGVVRTARMLTRNEYCWLLMTHMKGKEHKSLKEDRNVTREHKLLWAVLRVAPSFTCLVVKFWGSTYIFITSWKDRLTLLLWV